MDGCSSTVCGWSVAQQFAWSVTGSSLPQQNKCCCGVHLLREEHRESHGLFPTPRIILTCSSNPITDDS
ncbi:hypothetical protein NQZ68_001417 [Dissostichus eleginoides]|nr:hypothetical protein NQZ68_001417 [Dissostichus eleginoides]